MVKFNYNYLEQWDLVKTHKRNIRTIKSPHIDIQRFVLNRSSSLISEFECTDENLQLEAIKYDSNLIQHIRNPSRSIIKHAIKKNPKSIQHIKHIDDDIQLELITETPSLIEMLQNPCEKVQFYIARESQEHLGKIKSPMRSVVMYCLICKVDIVEWTKLPDYVAMSTALKQKDNYLFLEIAKTYPMILNGYGRIPTWIFIQAAPETKIDTLFDFDLRLEYCFSAE